MTEVFKPILEQMAGGNLENLYAQAVLSVDKEEIYWDGVKQRNGSLAIYSKNDVELIGTVTSLHPAILVRESSFQGNTTLHYELLPTKHCFLDQWITDGIFICYNGGEYTIPLHLKAPEEKAFLEKNQLEKTGSEQAGERKKASSHGQPALRRNRPEADLLEDAKRIKIAKLCLERMALQRKREETEAWETEYREAGKQEAGDQEAGRQGIQKQEELLRQLRLEVQALAGWKPDCIRYKLYEIMVCLESGEVKHASKLESRIRNVVLSAKKQHCTEYCFLLYLQYRIALAEKQYREAGVRRQQLRDYIGAAIKQTPKDPDVVLLLCSDCLDFIHTEPLELWETLQSVYQQGNNSPYLFFYGACLLENPQVGRMLDTGLDRWTGRCLLEGVKRKLITETVAKQAAECRPDEYAPFICRMYAALYGQYPSRSMLSALCTVMIRCDVQNSRAFTYYEQAANAGMKIARLYDYYIYTLPSGYEKPINREILLYFALDEYVNPQIYLKLCLNVLQFYRDDPQIFNHYGTGADEFLKNQIMRRSWSEDLALLAAEVLTADMLDVNLAQALIPMLYLVQVKAKVPDGYQILFESGIYKEPQIGIFKDGKACLCVPGGEGRFHVQDRLGKRFNGVNLKIRPLMQDEKLMERCEELCPDDSTLLLMKTHAWISKKSYYKCDFQMCMQYLKDDSLDEGFRKKLLRFILDYIEDHNYESTDLQNLCQCVDMMNGKQLAAFTEILIRKGYYTEAAGFLSYISWDSVDKTALRQLAKALVQYPENETNIELVNLLLYLLKQDFLEDEFVSFLAAICRRQKEITVKLYQICRERGISCPELNQYCMMQLLVQQETDTALLQELFIETVNLEQAELLVQAALNQICAWYVYGWCEMEADVMAALQSVVIHSGSIDCLTIPCQLACLKYDQEMGLVHEIEHMIWKEMCSHIIKQGIVLDFVQKEAAQCGMSVYPAVQVDISANGAFSENFYEQVKAGKQTVWAEYYIDGDGAKYRVEAKQTYDCLYSASIVMFAGETVHYCFHCGEKVTPWAAVSGWEGCSSADLPLDRLDRYGMLQQISSGLQRGESVAEQMNAYEKLMRLVEAIDQNYKES